MVDINDVLFEKMDKKIDKLESKDFKDLKKRIL